MHKEKSWRWGAIASPVHSRGPRASQWAVWWAAECDWSGSGQRHGLVETAGGLAGWRWMTMPLGDARWRWMLDRKCLILWMAQTELPARGGSPVWQSVETHDTDSGRLDDGIDGCACSETTVRPACRGSFPACAVPRRLLRRLEPEAPALSRLSLAGPGHRRRSVVLPSLRHGDRNRQPRQTGGRRHHAITQSAGAQPAHSCWRLQRLDVRRWASIWTEGGSGRTVSPPWPAAQG